METTTATTAEKTQLSTEDIKDAKTALQTYRTTCETLFSTIKNAIDTLRKSGFIGDASDGYDAFMDAMKPTLTTNLTDTENSATAMIDKILDSVEDQLLKTVDPQLKTNNTSAASGGTDSQLA